MSMTRFFEKRSTRKPRDQDSDLMRISQTQPAQASDDDGDCITVVPSRPRRPVNGVFSQGQTKAKRPLADADVPQAQNKRRRVLQCVLLPGTASKSLDHVISPLRSQHRAEQHASSSRRTVAKPRAVQTPAAVDPGYDSEDDSLARADSGFADENVIDGSLNSSPVSKQANPSRQTNSWSAFSTSSGFHLEAKDDASSGRPRRTATRQSYVPLHMSDGSETEDELPKTRTSVPSRRKAFKKVAKDESDFEDYGVDSLIDEDESDALTSDESISVDDSETPTSDDEVVVVAKKRKRLTENSALKQPAAASKPPVRKQKASGEDMKTLLTWPKGATKGLATDLPPLSEIEDIFDHLTAKAVQLGFEKATTHLQSCPLRVATMCSGTESPLLALEMVSDALSKQGLPTFEVEHIFSAEIVPHKQAYIQRNFAPPFIFRNIVEFIEAFESDTPMATTAYGARVHVPMDVDVVVAGTSCVDYSALNNKKKGISDGGESGLTWHGALAYCKACRPAIIVFENVSSADWDSMLRHYREIGYDCKGVLADTKHYYIPQTRQRGYMVCFDVARDSSVRSDSMGKEWQKLMDKFRRMASSPVSSFLIPTDQVVQRQQARDDDVTRDVDWSKCEITQMQYRAKERLGDARPITHWKESGTMLVPDHSHAPWYRRQVERVLDTIDCSVLRKALDGYDAQYKTRVWDLSQNIYRFVDHSPFGISGCITPDGIIFISDAGRIMAAEETLKLQGIPLDKISFTTETAKEQQDLAGNAMTTTVVGSALLSALIVGHRLVKTGADRAGGDKAATTPGSQSGITFQVAALDKNPLKRKADTFDPVAMLRDAGQARRACYCEGSAALIDKPLQECKDCGHTTHVACGGNPQHNFRQEQSSDSRLVPSTFANQLRSSLPLRLSLEGTISPSDLATLVSGCSQPALGERYLAAVRDARSLQFRLSHVRRSRHWTVTYVAEHARLELVLGEQAEWRLFALPGKDLSCHDWLFKQSQKPVAKATIVDDLLDVDWLWRRPVPVTSSAEVRAASDCMHVATWWARNEMPDYREHKQPDRLEVRMGIEHPVAGVIDGTYRLLSKCGTSCESLYIKMPTTSDEISLYLFLDPTRTGDPTEDNFVFSHDHGRLEYDEMRTIVARIKAPWRPWSTPAHRKSCAPQIVVEDSWLQALPHTHLTEVKTAVSIYRAFPSTSPTDCRSATLLVGCKVGEDVVCGNEADNKAVDKDFLADQAWLFEALRRELQDSDWQDLAIDQPTTACWSCAPEKPQLRWKLGRDQSTLIPYEDPATAATYERAVKARPDPFVVRVTTSQPGQVLVQFGIHLASLAHRALARLESGLRRTATVKWHLATDVSSNLSVPSFPSYQLQATRDIQPYNADLRMSVSLFPKQKLSLAWMRAQERDVEFIVEETEEADLPVLGWRAEVRASAPVRVRGGICADHPGFGKTILSLALIQAELLEMSSEVIKEELQLRRQKIGAACGLLPSSATLIVCLAPLVKQWTEEIRDKLGYTAKDGIIAITSVSDLARHTMQDFENAKIVVVSQRVFSTETYAERLAAFAGVPGPAKASGRALGNWLRYATAQVPEHLRVFKESGVKALKQHVEMKYRAVMESDEFRAAVPSRRLRGKEVTKKEDDAVPVKAASKSLDTSGIDKPLFEMFLFHRIIVDEFHAYTPQEYAAVLELQADKRWGLSGTPAIGDFYEVSRMAALLGVSLPIGSDAKGIMKAKNRNLLQKEMTDFERFDAMRQAPSATAHIRLHEIQQRFLDVFVTQNIADFAELKVEEHLVPVSLDVAHRAMYAELSQHMNSLDMRLKKGTKSEATDREARLHAAVAGSTSAEEALSKTAAYQEHNPQALAKSGEPLGFVISTRERELSRISEELSAALTEARAKEGENLKAWVKTRLDDGTLRDAEAISTVRQLLSAGPQGIKGKAPSKRRKAPSTDDDDDDDKLDGGSGRGSGKNAALSRVNTASKRLVVAQRSLRFLHSVRRVREAAIGSKSTPSDFCQSNTCQCLPQKSDTAVSALCGHIICKDCYKHLEQRHGNQCPTPGCPAAMYPHHLLWTTKMGDLKNPDPSPHGAKLATAISILSTIQSQNDQAILFVQYPSQLHEVELALSHHNIPAVIVKDSKSAGTAIANFRNDTRKNKDTVIVLNASDETAAGSNLQNANHVLFLSPLLRETQYEYDATMAQAIGRVRRHGQKKRIHVYRLVALDTIDVDILEHRERRVDALVEQGAPRISGPVGEVVRERVQLVRDERGGFSLQPRSWLVRREEGKVKGKERVVGWEDFSSLVKFGRAYTEDD